MVDFVEKFGKRGEAAATSAEFDSVEIDVKRCLREVGWIHGHSERWPEHLPALPDER